MGLLYYNNLPNDQLIKNGSFELPFVIYGTAGPDWYAMTTDISAATVERQSEVTAFSVWAAKLQTTAGINTVSINQAVNLGTLTPGRKLVASALVRGNGYSQTGALLLKFDVFVDNILVDSKTTKLFPPAELDFNNVYGSITLQDYNVIDTGATTLIVSYILSESTDSGASLYYIDNVKLEEGDNPTQWSEAPGESSISTIPQTFREEPPDPPNEGFDDGGPLILGGGGGRSGSGSAGSSGSGLLSGSGGGGAVASTGGGGCVDEYDESVQKIIERYIETKFKTFRNLNSPKWYAQLEDDQEFIKFVRSRLKKCFGEKEGSSTEHMWIQWANEKLASVRRTWELRTLGRIASMFGNGAVERFLRRKKILQEYNTLHKGLGS